MKSMLIVGLLFVFTLVLGVTGVGITQPVASQLPGSRATIDAAEYSSLQAALDALPAAGGLVRLPAGVFKISEPLRITHDDVCLEGAGTATHIQNENTDGQPAILVAHPECQDAQADRQHQLWRIRLANFRVTGNEKSGPGIEARQINEVFVDGVTASNHGGDGVLLNYCYEDPRIANCLITYNKATGVNLQGCHDIVVSATQFEENQDALHCFDGFNLCMTGNCVDDHLGDGVVVENTYGSVVSGNMIEECNGTAIVLDRDCYGITLSANVIAHNGGGIDLRDAHGCAVSANTFPLLKMPPKAKDGTQPPQLDTRCLRIGKDSSRITVTLI